MRIAVASDHRGYEVKRRFVPVLKRMGHDVTDFGCDGTATCDYPDFAAPAARSVAAGHHDVAVLFDGSGMGMAMVANKIRGVRAAVAHDEVNARRAREHHHCNVLCIGTDLVTEDHIRGNIEIFLATGFGDGRHLRRISKLKRIEEESFGAGVPMPSSAAAGS